MIHVSISKGEDALPATLVVISFSECTAQRLTSASQGHPLRAAAGVAGTALLPIAGLPPKVEEAARQHHCGRSRRWQ